MTTLEEHKQNFEQFINDIKEKNQGRFIIRKTKDYSI